ncbi:MAG: hypothetical protein IID06_02670 [Gemmatimonadetes bacterium]|nr:hypothetical protein [Gemmatimonadota bacterium]
MRPETTNLGTAGTLGRNCGRVFTAALPNRYAIEEELGAAGTWMNIE